MTIHEKEDAIFAKFKQKYDRNQNPETNNVVSDGIVNEDVFTAEKFRFMFVLKEASECYDEDFDLRKFLADGAPGNGYHTWAPVTRWISAVDGTILKSSPPPSIRKEILIKIGMMNLKKTSGGTRSDSNVIANAVKKDADLLKEQVMLYLDKPTLFPCCGKGVYGIFHDYIIKQDIEEEGVIAGDKKYVKFAHNGIAFQFRHPNCASISIAHVFNKIVEKLIEKF